MSSLVYFVAAFSVLVLQVCTCLDPEVCSTFPIDGDPNRIEGRVAEADTRPWIVLVWISCEDESAAPLNTCEGTLIRKDWILTAASCFPCGSASSVVVDIGLYNSDVRTEIEQGRKVERTGVEKIFVPTEYVYPNRENDIALLHLTKAVKDSSRVISIIDCSDEDSREGRVGFSSGWGANPPKSSLDPKPLHDAHVCLWPEDMCQYSAGHDTHGLLCAGAKEYPLPSNTSLNETFLSRDAILDTETEPCFVERGSPLVLGEPRVLEGKGVICEWRLCGVLSFGMQCLADDIPGFYTDVCNHRDWIEATIQIEEDRKDKLSHCSITPQPPLNGYLCSSASENVGVVKFCCNNGYRLSGSSVASCDKDLGRWEPALGPQCLPVECPPLPTPDHGLTTPHNCSGSSYQMSCWFTCDEGYQPSGSSSGLLTCLEDGRWSDPAPNCQAVTCGPPPHAGNLQVHYSTTHYNSTAIYTCGTCFRMGTSGNVMKYCGTDGKWEGPHPICEAIKCSPLSPPTNGVITQSSHACGTRVRFECDNGFNLAGEEELECLETGEWSHAVPSCSSTICHAPHVEDSNFKETNRSYAYGAIIQVRCDRCRQLVDGDGSLTCTATGQWDKPLPSCQWATCPLPGLLDNGDIKPLGQLYFCGTTVEFECDDGFVLDGRESSTCLVNGTWSSDFPSCREVVCPDIVVSNGTVHHNGTRLGDMATVSCDQCHALRGAESLWCMETGEWNSSYPSTCELVRCPPLRELEHGQITPSPEANGCLDTVFFTCDAGHNITGPLSITCTENGEWTNEQPTCEVVRCPSIPTPASNSYTCNNVSGTPTTYDTTVEYCCDEGYKMEAGHSGVLRCTELGEWNSSVPSCELILCEIPNEPENGHIASTELADNTTHLPYGTKLSFNCDEGYTLLGHDVIRCGEGGDWNHAVPQCKITECTSACPRPIVPDNGWIVNMLQFGHHIHGSARTIIPLGAVAVFMCNPGHYLHGPGSRRCMANGVWSGQKPLCLPFDQPRGRFIFRSSNDYSSWLSTDSAHFAATEPLLMACQTHMEDTGIALPISKIAGPEIDSSNVRVGEYGNPERSMQMALQPKTTVGGLSMSGTYLCQIISANNTAMVINRTLTIHVHESLCPFQSPPRNGILVTSGTTPGSCLHTQCNVGYSLLGSNDRRCLNNGSWSTPEHFCINNINTTCTPPNTGSHAKVAPPPPDGQPYYHTGDTVVYSCPPTYQLVGQPQRMCLGRDIWSGTRPVCVEKTQQE